MQNSNVFDYSHRDRRAQHDVDRAFYALVGLTSGLTIVALVLPLPVVGIVCVIALAVLGFGYMGWSDRTLDDYTNELRAAREGRLSDGFVRAEITTAVGSGREAGAPPTVSPHSRRRTRPSDGAATGVRPR